MFKHTGKAGDETHGTGTIATRKDNSVLEREGLSQGMELSSEDLEMIAIRTALTRICTNSGLNIVKNRHE